jgi:hypothetical protein
MIVGRLAGELVGAFEKMVHLSAHFSPAEFPTPNAGSKICYFLAAQFA